MECFNVSDELMEKIYQYVLIQKTLKTNFVMNNFIR